jgi:hypothetical protein
MIGMVMDLIGVPFDGMGRSSGQAGAPAALCPAVLEASFPSRDVVSSPELRVPAPRAERGHSGLLNEVALLTMIQQLSGGLRASIAAGRFPLVYGADCSVLMAALPALRDSIGEPGLLFILAGGPFYFVPPGGPVIWSSRQLGYSVSRGNCGDVSAAQPQPAGASIFTVTNRGTSTRQGPSIASAEELLRSQRLGRTDPSGAACGHV